MSFGWRLDEIAHAGRENVDADQVARYGDKEDADAAAAVRLLEDLGMNLSSYSDDLFFARYVLREVEHP